MVKLATSSKYVLEYNELDARRFFLKAESYASFDLPPYIVFGDLLASVDSCLNNSSLRRHHKNGGPRKFDGLNHIIFSNKDGKYSWRPLQLVHPALYVSLVHTITQHDYWQAIRDKFREFSQNNRIVCVSCPVESNVPAKDRAKQILNWWFSIEQDSIELALDYEYLIQTDITDCYGSIYTHSVAWALHGRDCAKKSKNDKQLIGNNIDIHLQDMQYGQTNGIPQGSVLMDFIAEIVLGYADSQLSEKIVQAKISDYRILRYRDDYRIFVNNPAEGELIVKLLTEILVSLSLKVNTSKTCVSHDVIRDSIKSDKLYWISTKQYERDLQKHLLLIHDLAVRYRNSGSLIVALTKFRRHVRQKHDWLSSNKKAILPLVSIIVDIAYHNPKTYAIATAILSDFIDLLDEEQKTKIIPRILKKFSLIPNTGYLQIWLQRIAYTFDKSHNYDEPICDIVFGNKATLWNNAWLADNVGSLIESSKIVDRDKLESLSSVVADEEVNLFEYWIKA
jgi:RNA-directed DNA polymerase